jgi:hypothetical protein
VGSASDEVALASFDEGRDALGGIVAGHDRRQYVAKMFPRRIRAAIPCGTGVGQRPLHPEWRLGGDPLRDGDGSLELLAGIDDLLHQPDAVGLLGAGLLGWPVGLYLAMALCSVQIGHVIWLTRGLTAFPVQVRTAYLALLALGFWEPFHWIHWMQLAGTMARVLIGYCFLARTLSLAPWNRSQRLSFDLIRRAYGSFQTAAPPCGEVFRMSLERVHG